MVDSSDNFSLAHAVKNHESSTQTEYGISCVIALIQCIVTMPSHKSIHLIYFFSQFTMIEIKYKELKIKIKFVFKK